MGTALLKPNDQVTGPLIKELIVTPIAITDPPLLNAAGVHAPYALRTIIELITEDGISGISEIPGSAEINAAFFEVSHLIIDRSPYHLNQLKIDLEVFLGEEKNRGDNPWDQRKIVHVFSALEVACLDIVGKITNRPVVDLLGGRCRDRVPYAAYLFYKYEGAGGALGSGMDAGAEGWPAVRQMSATNPDEIVRQARSMCQVFGFKSIKLKGGAFPPEQEVAAMHALAAAYGPDTPLRFDPNAIWTYETGLTYGRQMEGILEYLEDPVRGQENMARLKQVLGTPLATNMCTTSFDELPGSLKLQSEDIILSDHHFWGGLRASMHLSQICQHFGRKLSMHSNSHLGISLAAMTHLGAALPEIPYALDTHYPWQSEDVIIGGKLPIEDGCVAVPSGPGLGVELDYVALEKLHANYLSCGLTERNDELQMQKKNPDWFFQKTRW